VILREKTGDEAGLLLLTTGVKPYGHVPPPFPTLGGFVSLWTSMRTVSREAAGVK
jgi:hypothetical protein